MSEKRQFCTFELDGRLCGIEVVEIQEVIRWHAMTRVPLAPSMVRGLINLRGQIVTAIDLRNRLGLPPLPPGTLPTNIVVRTPTGPISLLVDEIGDVVEVSDEIAEPPPGHLTGFHRAVTRGVYKLDGRLMLSLDTQRLLQITDAQDSNPAPGETARAA